MLAKTGALMGKNWCLSICFVKEGISVEIENGGRR